MKKNLQTYIVESPQGLHYSYKLYRTYKWLVPAGYGMHIRHNETGKMLEFDFPLEADDAVSAEKLYTKICFKGFVRVQEQLHPDMLAVLRDKPGGEHYFSWDTHIFEQSSSFNTTDESYCFHVCGWHLNHQAISREFLISLFGQDIQAYFPTNHWQTMLWVITRAEAYVCLYDQKQNKELSPRFHYSQPFDLFMLLATSNAFRHYYDKYQVVDKNNRVAR